MKRKRINKFIICTVLILLITSCKQADSTKRNESNGTIYCDTIDDRSYKFVFDSLSSNFHFSINDSSIFRQEYTFDKYGCLIEKKGLNFWGEEEKYIFDVNNSLKEFRKSVYLNSNKIGLQEFIRYENGLVDTAKSHFFKFDIVDSTENDYNVLISYCGAFTLKEMSIYVNDFSYTTDELDLSKPLTTTKNKIIDFWTKKKTVYEDDFGSLQINLVAKFENDGELLLNVGDFKNSFTQTFILRKWK